MKIRMTVDDRRFGKRGTELLIGTLGHALISSGVAEMVDPAAGEDAAPPMPTPRVKDYPTPRHAAKKQPFADIKTFDLPKEEVSKPKQRRGNHASIEP